MHPYLCQPTSLHFTSQDYLGGSYGKGCQASKLQKDLSVPRFHPESVGHFELTDGSWFCSSCPTVNAKSQSIHVCCSFHSKPMTDAKLWMQTLSNPMIWKAQSQSQAIIVMLTRKSRVIVLVMKGKLQNNNFKRVWMQVVMQRHPRRQSEVMRVSDDSNGSYYPHCWKTENFLEYHHCNSQIGQQQSIGVKTVLAEPKAQTEERPL
jgi:hypothetical protein